MINDIILRIKSNLFINNTSKSCEFYSSDTEDIFKKNLQIQPTDWRYRSKKVEYVLNSNSFRTIEFKDIIWEESVVIFGCSQTFGVGLAEDETISFFLSKLIDRPVINMGVPASSPTFAMHNALILKKGYSTPKAVVNIWSGLNRTVFYHPYSIQHDVVNENQESYNYQWNKVSTNPITNSLFLQQMSKIMWEGIPYYEMTMFDCTSIHFRCDLVKNIDYARDLVHLGHETAYVVAKKIAENLKI